MLHPFFQIKIKQTSSKHHWFIFKATKLYKRYDYKYAEYQTGENDPPIRVVTIRILNARIAACGT